MNAKDLALGNVFVAPTSIALVPAGHPDAEVFRLCVRLHALHDELDHYNRGERNDADIPDELEDEYSEVLRRLTALPARTMDGLRVKACAVLRQTQRASGDWENGSHRTELAMLSVLRDAGRSTEDTWHAAEGTDADFIALCARHVVNHGAYERYTGPLDAKHNPLWAAYEQTRDAIHEAEPQSIQGMLAKARAAKIEAGPCDDPDDGVAIRWAWDLVNDLLRLYGRMPA